MILEHDAVDLVLDGAQLVGGQRRGMGEVEAQALGAHRGARLAHVLAELVAERALQEVGARVVGHGRAPAREVDARVDGVAGRELAVEPHEQGLVALEAVDRLDLPAHGVRRELAAVGDLAAALGIERRARELDEREPLGDRLDGQHRRLDVELVVAHELRPRGRAREARDALVVDAVAAPRGRASALALSLHVSFEALDVDTEVLLARKLGRQLDREPMGVVEIEDVGCEQARFPLLLRDLDQVGEQARASHERAREARPPRPRSTAGRQRGSRGVRDTRLRVTRSPFHGAARGTGPPVPDDCRAPRRGGGCGAARSRGPRSRA